MKLPALTTFCHAQVWQRVQMPGIAFAAITENGKNNELICTHRERERERSSNKACDVVGV